MERIEASSLLHRVESALDAAAGVFAEFGDQRLAESKKSGGDPVTEADLALDRALKSALLSDGEGWLSEETVDDRERLDRRLVWIVDPLDGTREFVDGLPEFCTSVAAVVEGSPVAGGVLNPAAEIRIVGATGIGVFFNGSRTEASSLGGGLETVLASRSEVKRGQWESVAAAGITVHPMGSVAYKLARVAAGLDPVTWTPVPKHEWDVAGGAALLLAAGGAILDLDGNPLRFNQPHPWMSGVIAVPHGGEAHVARIRQLIGRQLQI